ncbi:MAG: FprA family A-type flavoprotein [Rikenellaceae bacterium]|nr:FprA family A-type flavoprotein [Rikenellaceae bacterium]MCL2692441.1 FprA family A-type flavoprotein [Rikenellaceae bacterium]
MQYSIEIGDGVHWIGVNDRRKALFENLWPLPDGVSYNSYLIADTRTALIDTIESGCDGSYLCRIESLLGGRALDYLVINHMELDHSGEIETIVRRWPDVRVVGNSKTFNVLKAYFGDLAANLHEVKEGDVLELGRHSLKFVMTPMVHWPETMMAYEATEQILFSGDAFGTFGTLDGGVLDSETKFEFYESEMRRYYSNIVGKYGQFVQKALAKLADVPVKTICSLHGPVWRENVARVIGLYDKWSRCEADDAVVVIYGSMYGNTARMADYIANRIAGQGMRDIRVYDSSKTHLSYLISEIWRCRTVILGSCAYNLQMFPTMETLTREIEHYGLGGRRLAIFGTCSWSGGGVRNLRAFGERAGWEIVAEAEILGRPNETKYADCDALAKAVVGR